MTKILNPAAVLLSIVAVGTASSSLLIGPRQNNELAEVREILQKALLAATGIAETELKLALWAPIAVNSWARRPQTGALIFIFATLTSSRMEKLSAPGTTGIRRRCCGSSGWGKVKV